MRIATLIRRNLAYFWRTNVAVVFGVATAVAVLAGAVVVGDSVRASLRDLVLNRLGKTDVLISAAGFFPESLAGELARGQQWSAVPLIVFEGLVTHEAAAVLRAFRCTALTNGFGSSTTCTFPSCQP